MLLKFILKRQFIEFHIQSHQTKLEINALFRPYYPIIRSKTRHFYFILGT